MRVSTWHDLPAWRLVSYGNGTALELISKEAKASVFFQGGDALEFLSELESYTERGARLDYADAFAAIWNSGYGELAEPWKDAA